MTEKEVDILNQITEGFRGCIFIQKEGKTLFSKSYGYAHLADKIENTIETKFATASAGKVFVAVGILSLIEQGKLSFQSKIKDFLKFDLQKIDPQITILQLLTHTSGIPDYFDESIMEEYEELWIDFPNYKIRKNEDLLSLFIQKPMMYEKGEKFQYNNTGYVILAMIVEAIQEKTFDLFLNKTIFQPCKMKSTGYFELDMLPDKCAQNYIYDEKRNGYRTNIYSVDVKGTGAGGVFTTILDIELFWKNLLAGNLISKTMLEEMLKKQVQVSANDNTAGYGYGVWTRMFKELHTINFQGSDPGVSFYSEYCMEEESIITVVSNYGDDVWKLMRELRENLYQQE